MPRWHQRKEMRVSAVDNNVHTIREIRDTLTDAIEALERADREPSSLDQAKLRSLRMNLRVVEMELRRSRRN